MNIGLSVKHTSSLNVLNKERERLQKEMGPKYAYDVAMKIINAVESNTMGKITLNFKDQYENDEWKLDIEAENVND